MIHEITTNLFFIERGWLNANHFVFNGRQKVLIDTGYIGGLEDTGRIIEAVGVRLKDVDLIVSTHSHCDHIGGNRSIQEISGCRTAMHRIDKHFIDSRDDWATWLRYYDQEADFFNVDIALNDADTLYLDDLELDVIHTPGHAAGMISLYAPEEKFLISSDACWDGDLGALTPRVEGTIAPFLALDSLDRLAELEIHRMYPGHGPPIEEPASAIRRCKEKLYRFLDEPSRIGNDQLRKLFVYVLMMKGGYPVDSFLDYLLSTPWYRETVDLYFNKAYEKVCARTLEWLLQRKSIYIQSGRYFAAIRP